MYKTLFVVDKNLEALLPELPTVISFESYLRDYPKLNEPKTRVINLCNTERYLSQGYYCSLLAEARRHKVLPDIKTINALRSTESNRLLVEEPEESWCEGDSVTICMGEVMDARYKKLAHQVFQQFPAPLLQLTFSSQHLPFKLEVRRCSLQSLDEEQLAFCVSVLADYPRLGWRKSGKGKRFRWDMVILTNPQEKVPPSDKGALSRFQKAAEKQGIRAQLLSASELAHLNQFDALFIRETTAIDHHTYRLAIQAEQQGLVVMDDPGSILRCCNKVFLHDAFNYQKVPSLATVFVGDSEESSLELLENHFDYPMILKLPEGSFSKGVFKAEKRQQLKELLEKLLRESALVLAQEYLYTDYDWRIGVLNGRAIYACRYYMARNHWQIYNHDSKRNFSGGFDTLPTFEVPKAVLDAALKASAVVGNGLYGVDIKVRDGKTYVIEVNDNPSIDHKVEDRYLGEELYMQIMAEFLVRLESRGR